MFECGSRLGLELVTVVGLKKQVLLLINLQLGPTKDVISWPVPSFNLGLWIKHSWPGASISGNNQLPPSGEPQVSVDCSPWSLNQLWGVT